MLSVISSTAPGPVEHAMNDEQKWQAVLARDRRCDGHFYFGVLTTKIYCQPSCSSRHPLRKNVRFYVSAAAAEADGLRACKRCIGQRQKHAEAIADLQRLCAYIAAHCDEEINVAQVCAALACDQFQVHRLFKAFLTITPKEYIERVKLDKLKQSLRDERSVTDAIYAAGFASSSVVYGRLNLQLGMTPATYRRGGEGVQMSFAIGETSLGKVMIGATERGVCYLQFGDSDVELLQQLQNEYPHAQFSAMPSSAHADFALWMHALEQHLQGQQPHLDLPIDLRGTAFQLRVWEFLRQIPYGDVLSYQELANAIDAPRATRAVASACAANRIGIIVPCHRVIRGDGGMGGYRWGLPRKRTLLDTERRASRLPPKS